MKKRWAWVLSAVLLFLVAGSRTAVLAAPQAAYITGAVDLWFGEGAGEAAIGSSMTNAFGPQGTGWNKFRMANGVGSFLPGAGYSFIYLDGSQANAIELATYLDTNRAAIEAFVSNGGSLLLNCGPNVGGNINFGFGGVTLIANSFHGSVTAADPNLPEFNGPLTPVGTSFSGNWFSHAIVSGPGLTPIIYGTGTTNIVLGGKSWGTGLVLVGGMTTPNFHSPQPNASNLLTNILFAAANKTAIVHATSVTLTEPGSQFGTAYFTFDVTNLEEGVTGFRVFYGARPGSVPSDYDASFDIGLSARSGLIDQKWGMQGVPMVFFRIAPLRNIEGEIQIGELSNEAYTYFSGYKFTTTKEGNTALITEEIHTSSKSNGCAIAPGNGLATASGIVSALAPLAIPFLGIGWLRRRRK